MIFTETILAADVAGALRALVQATKLHPILVNFTAALVPVSVAADLAARLRRDASLRDTAWWTLLVAALVTPLTAVTGWLFWAHDDNGVTGMAIHKWLGTALVVWLAAQLVWRHRLKLRQEWATAGYLLAGLLLVAALVVQGHLGGAQVFSGP